MNGIPKFPTMEVLISNHWNAVDVKAPRDRRDGRVQVEETVAPRETVR